MLLRYHGASPVDEKSRLPGYLKGRGVFRQIKVHKRNDYMGTVLVLYLRELM
jgi:hypothetical protein